MTVRDFQQAIRELEPTLRERAARSDADDSFVSENYAQLKEKKLFSMLVPAELGGGGASYRDACEAIRGLARSCAATALALSMHMHLLAATVFRHKQGLPVVKLL